MIKVVFLDGEVCYAEFEKINANIVSLKGQVPENRSGFKIFNRTNRSFLGKYEAFTTIYRKGINFVEYSNDGSVYVEPPEPIPVISFVAQTGGTLEGATRFETDNWNGITVPVPVPDDGYVFEGWIPELPQDDGRLTETVTYTAMFKDCHVYFTSSEGGYLEGETRQYVEKYEDLSVPEPIAYEGYQFVSWSPEIPSEGIADNNNLTFNAMFKYTIPEDVAALKEDMTALNKLWGGDE